MPLPAPHKKMFGATTKRNKDKISNMKLNNTLSNLPNNRINAYVSRTLCVQAGTTDRATTDPRYECRGPPGGRGPQFKNRRSMMYITVVPGFGFSVSIYICIKGLVK